MEKDWFKYWIRGIHSIYIVPPYLIEWEGSRQLALQDEIEQGFYDIHDNK